MTETSWSREPIEPLAESPRREFVPEDPVPVRPGWRRWHEADCWVSGSTAITDEVIVRYPRDQVQQFATERTGRPLPDEAFPPDRTETEMLLDFLAVTYPGQTAAERMEHMIRALLASPRRDVDHGA